MSQFTENVAKYGSRAISLFFNSQGGRSPSFEVFKLDMYAYGVFISQLIRYARACSSYECFILRAMRLSNELLGQGYVKERLKSSLRKFYGRYGDLTKQYEVPLSRMLHDILDDDHIQWHPPLIGHYTNFWTLLIWTLMSPYYRIWLLPNCTRFP